jgi:hypothetical protein
MGVSGRFARASLVTLAGTLAVAGAATAAGTVVFDGTPGTKAPPARLGGVTMTKFARDNRPRNVYVTSVTAPTGRVTFGQQAAHYVVKKSNKPGYWRSWSHHYHGDVYYFAGSAKLTLPARTTAFYFYAEPNDPGTFKVTARTRGATSGPLKVQGSGGATFFGFIAKGGANLRTITVTSTDRRSGKRLVGGFALGEFGIHGS